MILLQMVKLMKWRKNPGKSDGKTVRIKFPKMWENCVVVLTGEKKKDQNVDDLTGDDPPLNLRQSLRFRWLYTSRDFLTDMLRSHRKKQIKQREIKKSKNPVKTKSISKLT
jgi:hypothetical protein